MKLQNPFLKYLSKNNQNFIFVILFYTLWIVCKYASTYNPELYSFSGRMIGNATLEGFDIGQRVKAFYFSGLLFVVCFFFFSYIAWRISQKNKRFFTQPEMQLINYSSLAGIFFLFFSFWNSPLDTSLELLYTIHKVAIGAFIIKTILLKNTKNYENITVHIYAIVLVISFSIYFLLNELSIYFGVSFKIDLHFTLFILSMFMVWWMWLLIKNKTAVESKNKLIQVIFILIPLALIPTLSIFKSEIYLVLKANQLDYFTPAAIYTFGLAALLFASIWRHRKIKNNHNRFINSIPHLLTQYYFPSLILGFTLIAVYNPFIDASNEMFENANFILPIMEFKKFGVIPILEKFNSHALSDFIFGGVYTFFNGLNGHEIFLYDFLFTIIWALLAYCFLAKFIRNAYAALFLVLFFPLMEQMISEYHILAIIAIFAIHRINEHKHNFKNYFHLIGCIFFLILWRIDIGYSASLAIVGTLLLYSIIQKRSVINFKLLLKVILIFVFIGIAILTFIAWKNKLNVLECLYTTLNYLSSSQSYGYISLGDLSITSIRMQYFIFPLALLILFCFLVISYSKYSISRSQRLVYLSLIFLSLYYFCNFQRGIVAHTLVGGPDVWLSPFLFFILSGSVYLFLFKKTSVQKFVIFMIFGCFLLVNYKYPIAIAQENIYTKTIEKTKSLATINLEEINERCVGDMKFENSKYGNFKSFIASNLKNNQTFIDFSNTPMLYYLTQKISPSAFYQNPLTLHNDYLQENFIANLKNYDTPILVFSNYPETWWDNAIGVPNIIRHYKLAEYFYINYEPFALIDSLCIWKRKGLDLSKKQCLVYKHTFTNNKENTKTWLAKNITISKRKLLFKITTQNNITANLPRLIKVTTDGINEESKPKKIGNTYEYSYLVNDMVRSISFEVMNDADNIESIELYELEYLSDNYSTRIRNYDFKKLAYIWGTYDKMVQQEKVIETILNTTKLMSRNDVINFPIATNIDKSSGNTLLISIECQNDAPITMELFYGNQHIQTLGSFTFTIPEGKGLRNFAIRLSCQYTWFSNEINNISLRCSESDKIKLTSIKLQKGS